MKKLLIFGLVVVSAWMFTACISDRADSIKDAPTISAPGGTVAPTTPPSAENMPAQSPALNTIDHNYDYAFNFLSMLQKPLEEVERLLGDANIPYTIDGDDHEHANDSSMSLILEEDAEPALRFVVYLDETLRFRLGSISFEHSASAKEALQEAQQHFGKALGTWKDDSGMAYYEFLVSDGIFYTLAYQEEKPQGYFSTFPLDYHSPLEATSPGFSLMPKLEGAVIANEAGTCALAYSMGIDDLSDEIGKLGEVYKEAFRVYLENISLYGDHSISTSPGDFCLMFRGSGEWELMLNGLSFKLFDLVGTGDTVDMLYSVLGTPYCVTYNASTGYWLQFYGKVGSNLCMVGIGVSESQMIGKSLSLDIIPKG